MKLIIVRHGDAEKEGDDDSRNLTAEGRRDISLQSGLIRSTGWQVSTIRCSPLLRARQTAELIAEGLGPTLIEKGIQIEQQLAPGLDPVGCESLLTGRMSSSAEVWVFHAPDVKRLTGHLTGIPGDSFYFPPGTMVALNLAKSDEKGMLILSLQPEYIRALPSIWKA